MGEYAINPVPRRMLRKNLGRILPEDKVAKVTISIPEGRKIAKKTMNPKLGIVGGISVIGTTGIARSMSSEAYKNSIVTQIDVALALNLDNLVFVPGNIGEKLALKQLDITKQHIIQTGNYVGFMFEEAKKRGSGYLNVALFGVDSRDNDLDKGTRSDTIMIASLNKKTMKVKIASIYRDTLSEQEDGTLKFLPIDGSYQITANGKMKYFLSLIHI